MENALATILKHFAATKAFFAGKHAKKTFNARTKPEITITKVILYSIYFKNLLILFTGKLNNLYSNLV
jgi:hypothetical protein